MNGLGTGEVWAWIGALAFGVGYALVVYGPLRGKHGGYTSLLVVVGVMGTLAFVGMNWGWAWSLRVGLMFMATGGPMVAGEAIVTKYEQLKIRGRVEERLESLREVQNDSTKETPE